ncbi:MAG: TrmH family RNA methyltransferase [Patescibacteria group bacterium]
MRAVLGKRLFLVQNPLANSRRHRHLPRWRFHFDLNHHRLYVNNIMKKQIYLILDNLRSSHNVGAIFRTADAVGVKKIFLCGITPIPGDEKQGNRRVKKVSVGADEFVKWEHCKNVLEAIKKLKKTITAKTQTRKTYRPRRSVCGQIQIISLEQTPKSILFTKVKYRLPLALIVGNEIDGIGENALKLSDIKIEIPMFGQKNSLNVTTATGIALYKILEFV